MATFQRFLLLGAAGILVFDLSASLVSAGTGVPYEWFSIGSIAIYFGVGYVGARQFGRFDAVAAAVTVAFVEATLGWGISWLVGPGRVAEPELPRGAILITGILLALALGAIVGLLGAWVGQKRQGIPVGRS